MSSCTETLTKISVRVYEPLFKGFQRYFQGGVRPSVLKRDAVMDWVISGEIDHIQRDLEGKRLSSKARRFISGRIKKAPTVQASFALRKSTADALNAVVAEHNLVRDSLIGWMIAMLAARPSLLEALNLPKSEHDIRKLSIFLEGPSLTALDAIQEALCDPFFYLRHACEEWHGVGLYALELPANLTIVTCFLTDERVPGTKAHRAKEQFEDWMSTMISFPDDDGGTSEAKVDAHA
jgi:hypothetical protein